jgi:glutamate--cysteine ligase
LQEMEQHHNNSYFHFVQAQSVRHGRHLRTLPLTAEVAARYLRMAEQSVEAQRQIEAQDTMLFENYRQQYLSPERLGA